MKMRFKETTADVVELVYNRLKHLSALCERTGVELLKNGETCKMAIPYKSRKYSEEGRDFTAAAKVTMLKRKSSPQTLKGGESCSWEENLSLLEVAGSSPAVRTTYSYK